MSVERQGLRSFGEADVILLAVAQERLVRKARKPKPWFGDFAGEIKAGITLRDRLMERVEHASSASKRGRARQKLAAARRTLPPRRAPQVHQPTL